MDPSAEGQEQAQTSLSELASIPAVPASQANRARECRDKHEGGGGVGASTVQEWRVTRGSLRVSSLECVVWAKGLL